MKKISLLFLILLCAVTGLSAKSKQKVINNSDGSISLTRINEDGKAVSFDKKFDGFKNVTIVNVSKTTKNNPLAISLADYENEDVLLNLKCDFMISDSTGATNEIIWLVGEPSSNFPQLFKQKVPSGKWCSINSQVYTHLGANRQIYISGAGLKKENLKIYVKNLDLQISGENIGTNKTETKNWMEVPAIKDAYKGKFDYTGMAVCYRGEFSEDKVQKGVQYQADYITMGNEFKPDFIFNWSMPQKFTDFTAEDGKSYKVPLNPLYFTTVDKCLQLCKNLGLKMRGHVLVWHSQTPDWFFYENWGLNGNKNLVSPAEMTAREEWYIKTVVQHVTQWEKDNNNGERIVKIWDVVNECASDNATETAWLRDGNSSNWYAVFGNGDFIVNAFRYANKYAPKDVELVLNDYNCYSPNKLKALCKIIDSIQAAPDARINAVGMQSHIKIDYPKITGSDSYETAVQTFVKKGLNVQVTELDIANGKNVYNPFQLKARYKDLYTMLLRNRKNGSQKGIEGVTLWGLIDEGTWLNNQQEYKGFTQYPMLFKTKDYLCKPAFYGVLEAAENN